ncbi:PIN domain-containing protein [Glycomyces algeriensis]|jgi:predicted nucleic acid-binding protein|uniref:Ribonuclease VapC n=1 Tax=Glycomyces algeriensis TaxID=256037 RepID=A0A9W6LE23_9ACTN|nr:PIN domain-containing protein [Glycomyces algeriensis]MDA1368914.1 PIN domain-containing protein [Glycomyces algeriensis]MDR7352812.1 putative nucleic acid-binding protein [Glycomyces algeriensis]GLI40497.1 twitching motility protein PilT [Glycomyces algeriensis]
MSGRAFLDTNVLVYAVDDADPAKKKIARTLLAQADGLVLSAQVLNEFYVTVTRKLKPAIEPETAAHMVRNLARIHCVAVDAQLVQLALRAGQRWQLSHWDSLVIEAARQAGCSRVLTEDLATGAEYNGLVIENPFA